MGIPLTKEVSDETDRALAARLEALRRAKGFSLEEAAQLSGVSRATLSRIERGETSPTAHNLGRLCGAYGVTLSQLLAPLEEDAPRLIRFAEAQTWRDVETGFERTMISPPAEGYEVQIVWGELPPGADIAYPVAPACGLEQHVVLISGALTLTFEGETHELKPRDCLRVKINGPSRFQNLGRARAVYMVVIRKPL
jgi:transcriptional regulator with XRE-family HTH domain